MNSIAEVLGDAYPRNEEELITSFDEMTERHARQEAALNELIDLILESSPAIEDHGANGEILRELYKDLIANGAGQWVRGRWFPARILMDPYMLDYALVARSADVHIQHIIIKLLDYFESRGKGFIHLD